MSLVSIRIVKTSRELIKTSVLLEGAQRVKILEDEEAWRVGLVGNNGSANGGPGTCVSLSEDFIVTAECVCRVQRLEFVPSQGRIGV